MAVLQYHDKSLRTLDAPDPLNASHRDCPSNFNSTQLSFMMPEKRKFGTIISGNRQRNYEFSLESRVAMCAAKHGGQSYRQVAQEFHTTPSTVHRIYKRWEKHQTFEKKTRSGRPEKLNRRQRNYLLCLLKRNRRITYGQLHTSSPCPVSKRTIQRIVHRHHGRKWRAMERIPISRKTARTRLLFAQGWQGEEEELMQA
jgi:transposase